jgi:hypothetical protein
MIRLRSFIFLVGLGILKFILYWIDGISLSSVAKNICLTFDKRTTWRLHIEMIEATAFRTFIRIYSLFKSERLRADIKLIIHKRVSRSLMTYACLKWEISAYTYFLTLQRMQNKVLPPPIGTFPRNTPVRDLHRAFNLPCVYDYITKLCRQQAEVMQNHENVHVCSIGQGEARRRKGLKLAAVKLTTVQVTKLPL